MIPVKRAAGVVLAALLVVSLGMLPAAGHSEVPGTRTVLEGSIPPLPDGVVAQVVVSASDQVLLSNTTGGVVEVLDDTGRAFIRVGPEGAYGDFAAGAWRRSAQPEAREEPANGGAPDWRKVSDSPAWGWFDHRLHPTVLTAPPSARPGVPVVLGRWEVPLLVGGRRHVLAGRREFVRQAGSVVPEVQAESVPPGIQASAGAGRLPAVFLDARGALAGTDDLVVLGRNDEPMLRFSGDRVEGNVASPTFAVTAATRGLDDGGLVGAEQPPRWAGVATTAAAGWLEPRGAMPAELPADVAVSRSARVVHEWSVPLLLNGQRSELRAVNRWVPDPSVAGSADDGLPGWIPWAGLVLGAVVVGGGVGVISARRR